jgi:hypothetical protein
MGPAESAFRAQIMLIQANARAAYIQEHLDSVIGGALQRLGCGAYAYSTEYLQHLEHSIVQT